MVQTMEKAQVKEHPILFSGAMVRATLEDRKTQTRRVVKLPSWSTRNWDDFETDGRTAEVICSNTGCSAVICCPYGKVGDRLWVRETWCYFIAGDAHIGYKATDEICPDAIDRWHPSIHMPRTASRITLEITDIRVERLQEINEQDAIAEGVEPFNWDDGQSLRPIPAFAKLWDSINAEKHPWSSNPYVWAVSFRKLEVA